MSFVDYLNWLQAGPDHGAALCLSTVDFGKMKEELEIACRMLGRSCSYEMQKTISTMKTLIPEGQTK